jgi:hypothetical protein
MKKLAIISGATYILAWIIGLVLTSGGPEPDDPATEVASYFARHEHAAMSVISSSRSTTPTRSRSCSSRR